MSRKLIGFVTEAPPPHQAWFLYSDNQVKPKRDRHFDEDYVTNRRLELWDIVTQRLVKRGPEWEDWYLPIEYSAAAHLVATHRDATLTLTRL